MKLFRTNKKYNHLHEQIDRLAKYIMKEYPKEITEGGAVDVAIKIMTKKKGV